MSKHYGPKFTMQGSSKNIDLKVTFSSKTAKKTFFHSYQLAELIQFLIETADTSGWKKHSEEMEPDNFYGAILNALARHSHYNDDVEIDEEPTPYELLKDLLSVVHYNGFIDEKFPEESDDEEDDFSILM